MSDYNGGRPSMAMDNIDINAFLAQKDAIIREQGEQIMRLKRELDGLASERDLLLCENSNLRFELEMVELKRLQDERMRGHLVVRDAPSSRTIVSDRTVVRVHSRVQERYRVVCTTRHQHTSRFVTVSDACSILPPLGKHVTTISFPQKMDRSMATTVTQVQVHHEQTYVPAPTFMQAQNFGIPTANYGKTSPSGSGYVVPQQLMKKGSLRNTDIIKRSRAQNSYELSQDIYDKQIELLERKYGGDKARKAAITIQKAFRRYTLVKRFYAIANQAKIEKRTSRRLPRSNSREGRRTPVEGDMEPTYASPYIAHSNLMLRSVPTRSMSLRERRTMDTTPIPRSQSETRTDVHVDVNRRSDLLDVQQISSVSVPQNDCSTPSSSSNGYAKSRSSINNKKVPPEVPKRTSSISSRSLENRPHRSNGLIKTTENGSLSSVQSSGSDSSISTDRLQCDYSSMWKSKSGNVPEYAEPVLDNSLANITISSKNVSWASDNAEPSTSNGCKLISETIRKRQYRVGLNLFNKKPERGITYLIKQGFLENSAQGVARFLISRKGLSKQMIGEYLGNLQSPFSMAVLERFAMELDLSGMQIDVALRKYQQHYRMPGEAQKIERLMEIFSQRYCQCNVDIVARLRSPDTVFVLAFAIIMLNTDLHTPNIKPEKRMKLEDFIKNLRGIDDCHDIDKDMLTGIYERVKANEFKPGTDHVSQVMKVQATIVGKKPNLALPHRRLVCYCRLYEIPDITKRERPGVHQREVFLFNDLLVITKILSKKKSSVTYTFRTSYTLCGMNVQLFEAPHYPFGIRLSQRVDDKPLITFNARNEHDRVKFAEDLKESILEMDEMENLRIEAELERQKSSRVNRTSTENRDSGVSDIEVVCGCPNASNDEDDTQIKRSALSNSLLDIHEQFTGEKAQRRGSVGSLDSGMSVSFQSTSASTCSRSDKVLYKGKPVHYPHSFLGGLFNKKQQSPGGVAIAKSTEV
ncbi:putative regulation of ARF protein signal transduction [Trypoxylus dichotomus]